MLNQEHELKVKSLLKKYSALQRVYETNGDPNGVITESPGAIALDISGTSGYGLWVKETGVNTDSGWTGK